MAQNDPHALGTRPGEDALMEIGAEVELRRWRQAVENFANRVYDVTADGQRLLPAAPHVVEGDALDVPP